MKIKALFLYTEIAGYLIACLENLTKHGVEVHLIHFPVNKEAPFVISACPGMVLYPRNNYNLEQLSQVVEGIFPTVIYCSGWIDKDYLSICKGYSKKIPVVVGFDNKWKNTVKQVLVSVFNRVTIHKYFTYCWIPGTPQMRFARKLGFKDENILIGLYSCDYGFFNSLYLNSIDKKKKEYPHKFVFAGRYYDFKGIEDLWNAFIELQTENPNDWELWCLGTGDVVPAIHPKIKHFGFVQPNEIEKYIAQTGVFVLPSRFEPWGVTVHEFATAGFPLVCSTEVGAADTFLKDGENGFLFDADNVSELKRIMNKIMRMSDQELFAMGARSTELAKQITPDKWADTLYSVLSNQSG